jgi:NADP-dependent 3-hydroxy acid dehydrogenase YdfG
MSFPTVLITGALSGIRIGHATAETGWNHAFGMQAPARDGRAKR